MYKIMIAFMAAYADQINGIIEFLGSLFTLNSCRILYGHKMVRGVSVLSTTFFFLWGFWNTIWYPFLHQPFSFVGGALMAFSNLINVALMVYYKYIYGKENKI